MKMGVLGHHLGISWHGINLFPPHCFQSLNLLQLSTPWKLQHTRFPCASLSPRVCSNTCSLSQWCHPTISCSCPLLLLPSIFPITLVFSSESALHFRGPKYWNFSFSISPSNEYSGLISFRIDWFDLLAVQGTLKSLLQPHSSKVSVLRCSAFFMVQLSLPYMTNGKTIALTIQTFVDKAMSLLFNRLSRFPIFLAYLVGLRQNVFCWTGRRFIKEKLYKDMYKKRACSRRPLDRETCWRESVSIRALELCQNRLSSLISVSLLSSFPLSFSLFVYICLPVLSHSLIFLLIFVWVQNIYISNIITIYKNL